MSDDKVEVPTAEDTLLAEQNPAPATPEMVSPETGEPEPQATANASAPTQDAASAAPTEAPMAPMTNTAPPPLTPDQAAQARTDEHIQFGKDMADGRISPETYHSLYAKKDTLGKVGTLFGMLLAGAGSGLTHQPNALLEMMNKQIQNDLEAQKENQANKRSWYQLSLQHERQQPEIAAGFAGAQKAASEADMAKYLNMKAGITDNTATNDAMNRSTVAAVQYQQDLINKMPPGPKRDAAQYQQDNVTIPFFVNKIRQRDQNTEQTKALGSALSQPRTKGNPPPTKGPALPGARYDAYNQNEYARRAQLGRVLGDKAGMVPDAIPVNAQPEIDAQASELTANRNLYADAVKSFHHLAAMDKAGQAPGVGATSTALGAIANVIPFIGHGSSSIATAGEAVKDAMEKERSTQIETLVGQLTPSLGSEQARKTAEAVMPNFLDSTEQRKARFEQLKNHFTSQKVEEAPALKKYNLYYPAPKYQFTGTVKKETAPAEIDKSVPDRGKNKQ